MPKNQISEEETKSLLDEEEAVTESVSLPGTSEPVRTDVTEASSSFQPSVQPQTPETDSTVPVAPSEPQKTAKPVAKEPAVTKPKTERETTSPPKSTKETAPPKSETVPSVQPALETKAEPKTTPDPAFISTTG